MGKYSMHIREILTEDIKVRIDHPEDLVWQRGFLGMENAIKALEFAANHPQNVNIKWDGSPAILFGRDSSGNLIVTDKSGFNAKTYRGKVTSGEELGNMLYSRNPTQPGRREFSDAMASLWPFFEEIVPVGFSGFYQGDLLYSATPPVINSNFVFMPNKVRYTVPVQSEMGMQVAASKAGIVVHSYYSDDTVSIPQAVTGKLDLNPSLDIMVFGNVPVSVASMGINIEIPDAEGVDQLLDPIAIKNARIGDFKALVGKYIASMAANGENSYLSAPISFQTWVASQTSKPDTIKQWISDHELGYKNMWIAIAKIATIKTHIKKQFDQSPQIGINASLAGHPGHEGYVVDTPTGKIKLVDRFIFMKAQT